MKKLELIIRKIIREELQLTLPVVFDQIISEMNVRESVSRENTLKETLDNSYKFTGKRNPNLPPIGNDSSHGTSSEINDLLSETANDKRTWEGNYRHENSMQ